MKVSGKAGVLVFSGLLLVVGMASANVLDRFGVVSGEADVDGPTFYTAEIDDSMKLKINEEPTEEENFPYRQIGPDYSSEFFVSPDINEGSWYEMKVDFYVKAKTADDTESGKIQASFLYDTENSVDNLICSEDIYVNSSKYSEEKASCISDQSSEVSLADITGFTYKLEGGRSREFNIQADGVTRVEVGAQ